MPTIDRILCPLDFSPISREALAHAEALARFHKARLTVLHVLELAAVPDGLVAASGTLIAPAREVAAAEAGSIIEPMRTRGLQVDVAIEDGMPTSTILEAVTRYHADLVVMGTHGRSGLKHLLLGSVAERVLRRAACPVLVVPPAAPHVSAEIEFKHILCPIDLGPASMTALDYAVALASESLGILTVLHVLEPVSDDALAAGFDAEQFHAGMLREARTRLHDVVAARTRRTCRPIDLLTSGSPHKEILRVARTIGAQLVVMGVTGRGAVDRMIFGSTTDRVVRSAPCPVMTIREPAPAYADTPASTTSFASSGTSRSGVASVLTQTHRPS